MYERIYHSGGVVRGEVRARDVIGQVSPLVSSNGFIIDTTAPVRAKRIECKPNILSDASFENIMNYEDNTTICDNITESEWDLARHTCVTLEESNMAQHGSMKLHLQGSISQKVHTKMLGKYRFHFHSVIYFVVDKLSDNFLNLNWSLKYSC